MECVSKTGGSIHRWFLCVQAGNCPGSRAEDANTGLLWLHLLRTQPYNNSTEVLLLVIGH